MWSRPGNLLCVGAAVSLVGIYAYRVFSRPSKVVPQDVEDEVQVAGVIQEEYDEVEYCPEIPEGRHRFAFYMGGLAKGEFGLMKRTEANRLVVQHWIRDKMKEHGVRPSHLSQLLPIAVAVAFLPTRADIMAAQILGSSTFAAKEEEAHGWGHVVAGWFGATVRRPAMWAAK